MRFLMKGGLWKNTEDEVLKTAVMKYGKSQWARASSLLVRKSAKQCKARWNEWLDPSIKKTEWTPQEDEKLLHLANIMPNQWRTIGPIVGRTPSLCLERYERLLDAACTKDESYETNDDPRNLRPGEIDPNPESKPARPDPVDMDEDEKEMLSEARARLANTRGKKAKRKAREKQLEGSRRLVSLQKARELKAAGIDDTQKRRKRKGIDYNGEIPFEKKPPIGFYDVTDECQPVEHPSFPTTIEDLEGEKRMDKEARLRKQDTGRNRIAPAAIRQANKFDDPEPVRKRSKLMLPAPQISDIELGEIAKMGCASDMLVEGSDASRALLGNYGQRMTPLRTPLRTPSDKGDAIIMMEAENLARLRESQTPLLGGENPELHPSDSSRGAAMTPRLGMTPLRDVHSYGMTPKGTPIRDELHINEDMEKHDSAKLDMRRQADLRRNLRSGLSSLPQPKNEYQIVIQPAPEDNEEPENMIEEDMSDRIAREKAEEEAKRQVLVLKELPRPPPASFPTRNAFDLSSVAGNVEEKVGALRREFENVKRRVDDDTQKAQRLEQKVGRLTNGYQIRAWKIWSQIEATLKQMDTAGTELECFQALQKQEQEAASHRINGLWEEVQKQKELERNLQMRYGNLVVELDGVRSFVDAHRVQEEIPCS